MTKEYENNFIIPPPLQFRDGYRPNPKPRTDLQKTSTKDLFNFDDDIFQTENASLRNFKIINTHKVQNKKFNSSTNEFKIKILKPLDDVKEVYFRFQEFIKTVKRKRKLKNNDRVRFIIQNEELPNATSTKFQKVKDFRLAELEQIIKLLEYKNIPLESCRIIIHSVKIPNGSDRLYLAKDTATRKNCIITIKNKDTICLARSIVTAFAILKPECWTKTQVQDGFNKSRKLQKHQAFKLHEEANVEINDYGNDLNDVNKFANFLNIENNIIDSEQFNEIIYTANKGREDKIYLYKTRSHFDVIKSMTAFYNVAYYCHECKKTYTRRDKHKSPSKCLSCFSFTKGNKCEGQEIICPDCNRHFNGEQCFKNHKKNRSKDGKSDSVCKAVRKCHKCESLITGKHVDDQVWL